MIKRIFWTLVFAAIFLLGLAMRSPEILGGNYLFGFDQGQNYMRAYDIAVNHKFTLIGAEVGSGSAGVPGLFHGPGFYYLLAIMLVLFKGDPYGGLVLMWIAGVATMLVVFLTTRKMFGEKTALVSLFLISIAPLIAPQSRFVWGPHVGSLFIALFYYALYKMGERSILWTLATFFLAGLLYNFELAISVPLVFLSVIALFYYKLFNKKIIAAALAGVLLAYAPMIMFEVRHGFMATRGIVKNMTTKKEIKPDDLEAQKQGDFHLKQKQYQFIANFRDSFVFEFGKVKPTGYMRAISAVAAVILLALFFTRDKRAKRYIILLLFATPATALVFLPLRGAIWPYYLIHLHFVYLYAFAFASVNILQQALRSAQNFLDPLLANFLDPSASRRTSSMRLFSVWELGKRSAKILYPPRGLFLLASLFVIFFFLSMVQGTVARLKLNWLVDHYDYGGNAKIKGKRAIIDYIYADAAGKPFSVFVFMPPVYTWPYDYLFLTYAKEKYGYVPSQEKKGTAYMIIELDGTKPWSYKGWLETVIVTGAPVWERYLMPSDHVLQKRLFGVRP